MGDFLETSRSVIDSWLIIPPTIQMCMELSSFWNVIERERYVLWSGKVPDCDTDAKILSVNILTYITISIVEIL